VKFTNFKNSGKSRIFTNFQNGFIKFVKIHDFPIFHCFKITPPGIARLPSNLVQSLITPRWYTTNVQDQRSKVKVTGSNFKVTA